jgi:hypothetical protein
MSNHFENFVIHSDVEKTADSESDYENQQDEDEDEDEDNENILFLKISKVYCKIGHRIFMLNLEEKVIHNRKFVEIFVSEKKVDLNDDTSTDISSSTKKSRKT